MGKNLLREFWLTQLYYFWEVARGEPDEKTQRQVAERLGLGSPSSLSDHIRDLEDDLRIKTGLNVELFHRQKGKTNELTAQGQVVFKEAQKIFPLLQDIPAKLRSRKLVIGLTPAFPKYLAYFLLRDLLTGENSKSFELVTADIKNWAGPLERGEYDLVLADGSIDKHVNTEAFIHSEEGISYPIIVADENLIEKYDLRNRENFPKSLEKVPFILPPPDSTLGNAIQNWFEYMEIDPPVLATTIDRLLMVMFPQNGLAAIAISSVVASPVCKIHNLKVIEKIKGKDYKDNFFAFAHRRYEGDKAIESLFQRIKDYSDNPPEPDWPVPELNS